MQRLACRLKDRGWADQPQRMMAEAHVRPAPKPARTTCTQGTSTTQQGQEGAVYVCVCNQQGWI